MTQIETLIGQNLASLLLNLMMQFRIQSVLHGGGLPTGLLGGRRWAAQLDGCVTRWPVAWAHCCKFSTSVWFIIVVLTGVDPQRWL